MKKESEHVMAYKNIGRRVMILHKHGYLEEIKLENVENLHGRKDYKITMKGLELLIPYILAHPENIGDIIRYMRKFGLEEERYLNLLVERLKYALQKIGEYHVYTLTSIQTDELKDISAMWILEPRKTVKDLKEELKTGITKPLKLGELTEKALNKLSKKEKISFFEEYRKLLSQYDKSLEKQIKKTS